MCRGRASAPGTISCRRPGWLENTPEANMTRLASASPSERWYRHVIYGWNIYSLYEGQPLPGLAEAIRLRDPARIAKETARIESALRRMRAGLDQ